MQAIAPARRTRRAAPPQFRAIHGRVVSFDEQDRLIDRPDSLVMMERGRIVALGDYAELVTSLPPGVKIDHYPHGIVTAGLIDVACDITPISRRLAASTDRTAHIVTARLGIGEIVSSGTTTAIVLGTADELSAHAILEEAGRRGMRVILTVPGSADDEWDRSLVRLVDRWHGNGRLEIALCSEPSAQTEVMLAAATGDATVGRVRHPTAETVHELEGIATAGDSLGRVSVPAAITRLFTSGMVGGDGHTTAIHLLYAATVGGAAVVNGHRDCEQALIGRVCEGYEADLAVISTLATPIIAAGVARDESVANILYETLVCGDDRVIQATYISGRRAFLRDTSGRSEARPNSVPVPGLRLVGRI